MAGLPLAAMRQYLEHVADRRLAQLGIPPRYFFERRVSAYQVAVSGTVAFDEDFLSSERTVVLAQVPKKSAID